MAKPHVAPSAYKHGVTFHDFHALLRFPEKVMRPSDTHTANLSAPMSTCTPDTTRPENPLSCLWTGSRTWRSTRNPGCVATSGCFEPEIRRPCGEGYFGGASGQAGKCPSECRNGPYQQRLPRIMGFISFADKPRITRIPEIMH